MIPRSIEQLEESRSRGLNDEPSPRGKPVFISCFPFNPFISCINHVEISNWLSSFHLLSKQGLEKEVLEIFGDMAEPRGTTVPPLDKIFVQDVFKREHECLGKN
jgi:hypothetical protein